MILGGCFPVLIVSWWLTKPILVDTHMFARADDASCGAYHEEGTGLIIFNPLRSRTTELIANAFWALRRMRGARLRSAIGYATAYLNIHC
jgi:hypothetical protein